MCSHLKALDEIGALLFDVRVEGDRFHFRIAHILLLAFVSDIGVVYTTQ